VVRNRIGIAADMGGKSRLKNRGESWLGSGGGIQIMRESCHDCLLRKERR